MRYFTESSEALPDDPRLIGFLGSFKQAQGAIHNRPDLQRKGGLIRNKLLEIGRSGTFSPSLRTDYQRPFGGKVSKDRPDVEKHRQMH